MLKISFSIIVKDDSEVKSFKESLYSVLPYVKFAQITSNGKETSQIEALIESTRGIFPNVEIDYTHLPWTDDFSAQRNHSFNRVPKDTDFIYWQDADDLLVGGEHLQELAKQAQTNGKDVVFLAYWYGCSFDGEPSLQTFKEVDIEHYRERLIRPGVVTWKGRLHETPVPVEGQKNNYTKFPYHQEDRPMAVMHTASADESLEKMQRNQRILELQLKQEREEDTADPRTLLYLMKIYTELGGDLLPLCIEMGEEYLTKSGWDEERANACDLMAICSTKMGKNHEAIKYLHKAISEYPHQPLHYVRLALAYFNVGRNREARHWTEMCGQMELDSKTAGISNPKELKVLLAQIILKLKYQVDKDIDGAVEAAKALLKEQPLEENHENLLFLMDRQDLKNASENTLSLLNYLENIGDKDSIRGMLNALPLVISEQPFAINHRKKTTSPRIWGDKEICYFANFGGKHFEKWDSKSLSKGIGGSETAVIELSKAWVDMGYKVTIYGDPEHMGEQGGVTYLPWYYFNKGDKFNIIIFWRNWVLSPAIKSKKTIIDLHDIWNPIDMKEEHLNAIDTIMVKSEYHKNLAGKEMLSKYGDKFKIVSNGIDV